VSDTVPGYRLLLDAIAKLGGVCIDGVGRVKFYIADSLCASSTAMFARSTARTDAFAAVPNPAQLKITDRDLEASFSHSVLTAKWKWVGGRLAPELFIRVASYHVAEVIKDAYETEIDDWIEKGWLKPYSGHRGVVAA